ncbi:carboxylesterase family protein [uncultured Vibrio sp.]|uniref:carboxylesterase family protein n=1 Tax=uncultured Vibrio sp. TaxID=114054 RepID=UPI00260B174A|nr:carboxylesterase family protein [uncultured Vibrio sp.]
MKRTFVVLLGGLLIGCRDGETEFSFTPDPEESSPTPTVFETQIGGISLKGLKEPVSTVAPSTSTTISSFSETEQNTKLVTIETFKGIPYAYSGDSRKDDFFFGAPERFKHSVMLPLAEAVTENNAFTDFGDVCPQFGSSENYSETCLFLNIWRPNNTVGSDKLPVYVYVHSGSFETGSGHLPNIIPDVAVAQSTMGDSEFIAVTFNYRLGLLGKRWIEDKGNTKGGNFSLGDQKRALEWVNQYIDDFGGDSANVTVFGQGSGATSINALQQSTTEDRQPEDDVAGRFFSRAIMQSLPIGLSFESYAAAQNQFDTLEKEMATLYPDLTINQLTVEQVLELQKQVKAEITGRLFGLPDQTIENMVSDILGWIDEGDSTESIVAKLGLKYASDIASIEPRAKLLPFAPYIESHRECVKTFLGVCTGYEDYPGYHVTSFAHETPLKVPSIIGFNNNETDSYIAELKLLFLINVELLSGVKLIDVVLFLIGDTNDIRDLPSIPDIPAYTLISSILFIDRLTDTPLRLDDFSPSTTPTTLEGVKEDLGKFNKLNNQLLYKCAIRDYAKSVTHDVVPTLYHFDYVAGFNNELIEGSIFDTIGNLACFGGKACNQAEIPFIFNRLYNQSGDTISPEQGDLLLMGKMSRFWFSDDLFDPEYRYQENTDNILVISNTSDGSGEINKNITDWDATVNFGIDDNTLQGICDGMY